MPPSVGCPETDLLPSLPPSTQVLLSFSRPAACAENNTDYEVTVYASQQQIQVTHTFRISEGLLVPTASRVHGRAINPTTIRLEWTPSVRNHDIIEYQVCYREAGSSAPLQAQCMYR